MKSVLFWSGDKRALLSLTACSKHDSAQFGCVLHTAPDGRIIIVKCTSSTWRPELWEEALPRTASSLSLSLFLRPATIWVNTFYPSQSSPPTAPQPPPPPNKNTPPNQPIMTDCALEQDKDKTPQGKQGRTRTRGKEEKPNGTSTSRRTRRRRRSGCCTANQIRKVKSDQSKSDQTKHEPNQIGSKSNPIESNRVKLHQTR